VGELNTTVRGGIHWPMIYGIGLHVKTGEIFPATFPDKGPDQALRCARHLTGGQQVQYKMILHNFILIYILCTYRHMHGYLNSSKFSFVDTKNK
jgi:hypothetical protein